MNDFLTMDIFATFSGMIVFITILTQILKSFIPWSISPKIYSLGLSVVANLANFFLIQQVHNAQSILLLVFNIFIVAFSASGGYEFMVKPVQKKLEIKNITKLESRGE